MEEVRRKGLRKTGRGRARGREREVEGGRRREGNEKGGKRKSFRMGGREMKRKHNEGGGSYSI